MADYTTTKAHLAELIRMERTQRYSKKLAPINRNVHPARLMRELAATGVSRADLASRFACTTQNVGMVLRYQTYRNV